MIAKSYPHPKQRSNYQPLQARQALEPKVLTDGTKAGRLSRTAKLNEKQKVHQRHNEEQRRLTEQRQQYNAFDEQHGLSIPSKGVIDHVRFSLLHPLQERDRVRLDAVGFSRSPTKMRAKRAPGNFVYDPEPGAELLLRESDGCRVLVWAGRVAVVASLSRVLGLTNDRLHELTERDVQQACGLITTRLLPWSTVNAQFRGSVWAIAEIALAIDILSDAKLFAEAYERTKWKHCRKLPRRFRRGLAWEGSDHRLTLYDKGEEMRKRGVSSAPACGTVMRVEREWKGAASVTTLAEFIACGRGPYVRFIRRHPEHGHIPVLRSLDHRVLHQLLARELSLLDSPLPLGGKLNDAIAAHMAECDRFHDIVRAAASPKTYRKYRKKMLSVILGGSMQQTLLNACYG